MPLFIQQLIRGFPTFRCCYTGEWLLYPNNDSPAGLSCFRAMGFHLSWINLDNSGRQRRPIILPGDTLIFFTMFHLLWLIAAEEEKEHRNPGKVTISGMFGREKLRLLIYFLPFIFTATNFTMCLVFTRAEIAQNSVRVNLWMSWKITRTFKSNTINWSNMLSKKFFLKVWLRLFFLNL